MTNLPISKQILIIFLVLTVAISKHLIILNEEILVALSFLAFLTFSSKTFSESISSTLNARTVATHNELQNYLQAQLTNSRDLIAYHQQYLKTRSAIKKVYTLLANELKKSNSTATKQLKTVCVEQTIERMNTLLIQNSNFKNSLQTAIVKNFRLMNA